MTAQELGTGQDGVIRRIAYSVLVLVVRGRHGRGGTWGEAVLAEFGETRGAGEAVRWLLGGLRVAWQERRGRVRQLPRRQRIGRRALIATIAGALAMPLVNQWVLSSMFMPSGSMEPTMRIGDRYLVDKIGFHVSGLRYGDIVTFVTENHEGTWDAGTTFVKRVVGLPGDAMTCRDGAMLRNGTVIARPSQAASSLDGLVDCPKITVPDGQVYVLGDFLDVSVDSRQNGPIAQRDITGRVGARIWPFQR